MKTKDSDMLIALTAALPVLFTADFQWNTARETIFLGGAEAFVVSGLLTILWRMGNGWRKSLILRIAFAGYLIFTEGSIISEIWKFYQSIYPDQVNLWVFLALILGLCLFLAEGQRESLKNMSKILWAAAVGTFLLLVLSGLSVFHWENLSCGAVRLQSLRPIRLLPEYLIFCWLLRPNGAGEVVALPISFWGIQSLLAVVSELALGTGASRDWPLYRVALLGKLSVFNRLEWIQIMCWLLLLCIRLALTMWAVKQLFPRSILPGTALLIAFATAGIQQASPGFSSKVVISLGWILAAIILGRGIWHWEKSPDC